MHNCEFYSTDNIQYLLIHKNGCTLIRDTLMRNHNVTFSEFLDYSKISFSVLRDPWDRFISGLAFDLVESYGKIDYSVMKDIDYENIILYPTYSQERLTGSVPHVISQSLYLFNNDLDFYLFIDNLSSFLKLHFSQIDYSKKFPQKLRFKNEVKEFFALNHNIREKVNSLLSYDYYIFERLMKSKTFWSPSMGRMW